MDNPPAQLELRIASDKTGALADASRQLRDYLAEYGIDEQALYVADLAFEELGTNIFSYAFPAGTTAAFVLRATVKPESIELIFEDSGIAFDPSTAPGAKPAQTLEAAPIGGLGIRMVRKAVERMTYSRIEDHNHLEIRIARGR